MHISKYAFGLYNSPSLEFHAEMRPTGDRMDSVRPGVLYGYGTDGTALTMIFTPLDPMLRGIADSFFIASADYGEPANHNWGNDLAIARLGKLKDYVFANSQVSTKGLFLVGVSGGCFQVCNWARQNPGLVKGMALLLPALDLDYFRDSATYGADVIDAYGSDAAVTAALPTHSPIVYASELRNIPMQVYYSDNDPVVPNSQPATFTQAIPKAELINMGSLGHNVAPVTNSDVGRLPTYTPADRISAFFETLV